MTSAVRPSFVDTLAAWCVVPYDDRERAPEARAKVLANLGIDALAWDWRDEHAAQLGEQADALAAHNLTLAAIWAPVPEAAWSARR